MKITNTLKLLVLLTFSAVTVSGGPLCFSCTAMQHASYCDYTEQCADHQVCHVQKIRTSSGHFEYTSGCVNNATCNGGKRSIGQHVAHGQVTCIDCCTGEMCNNKGCGDPGPPTRPHRGLYCFQCQHMADPSECEQLAICEIDELCAVEEYALGFFGHQFSSGCKRKEQCEPLVVIGRDTERKERRLDLCNKCCNDDFCNKNCGNNTTGPVKTGAWSTWGLWSTCPQDGCVTANQTRQRTCIDQITQQEVNTCVGPTTGTRKCVNNCQVSNASWTTWGSWSICPPTACAPINQTRNRTCIDQITHNEVNTCSGSSMDSRLCAYTNCSDCKAIYNSGLRSNGVYTISPMGTPFDVLCDMDEGGWIVVQRRFDGHLNFTRKWTEYKLGFGSFGSEFWLGNEYIYQITRAKSRKVKFILQEYNGSFVNGSYGGFSISSEDTRYKLYVSNLLSGNMPSHSFVYNNGAKFSTFDRDYNSCANRRHGGWWYQSCTYLNINGKYGLMNDESGVIEHYNSYHNFQATTMLIQ